MLIWLFTSLTKDVSPSTVAIAVSTLVAVVMVPLLLRRYYHPSRREASRPKPSCCSSSNMKSMVPADSRIEFVETILPHQCNMFKVLFGGELLAMVDKAAGAAAVRHSGGFAVTASMEEIHFITPIKISDIVIMHANVTAAFSSSMEIEVLIEIENPLSGEREFCARGLMVFVALDSRTYLPRKVPALKTTNKEEQRKLEAAQARRKQRSDKRKQIRSAATAQEWKQHLSKHPLSFADNVLESSASMVEMNQVVMPQHSNPLQITFGGQVVKWMEQACSISALRLARQKVVTVGLDQMSFHNSSRVGDVLRFRAQVNRVFDSSMEVGVRVDAFSVQRGTSVHCNSGFFTFVCVDEQGRPCKALRQILPANDEDKLRSMQALERRDKRQKSRERARSERAESAAGAGR